MAFENYRPIQFPEKTEIDNTDVVLIDSSTNGTNKYQLSRLTAQAQAEAQALVDAEATAREQDVDDLKADLNGTNDYIFDESAIATEISAITGINTRTGWNASDGTSSIAFSSNASYDSYWFVTANDVDVWFDSISASYFAFIVGGTFQSTQEQSANSFFVFCENGSTRYRKSDGNLPTESNKIHIPAGCAVAFTLTHGSTDSIYGLSSEKIVKETFKQEVLTGLPESKKPKIKYINGSGVGSSTERLEIHIPSTIGYIRYDFVHSVDQTINADNWRIHNAYAVDDTLLQRFALTTSGEWEAAIHLAGKPDFSGGIAHGDEIVTSLKVFVDGEYVDPTTLTDIRDFKEIRIIETSNMYDPDDNTTLICKHGSEHIFNSEGVIVNQNIIWSIACSPSTCYLAMFPPAKFGSDKLYMDTNYEVETLPTSNYRNTYPKAKSAVIYNETNGFWAEFSIPKYPTGLSGGDYFWVMDNGGSNYNKMYYVVTTGTTVQPNDMWQAQTVYKLDVSK